MQLKFFFDGIDSIIVQGKVDDEQTEIVEEEFAQLQEEIIVEEDFLPRKKLGL